jgi:hypothetical protein
MKEHYYVIGDLKWLPGLGLRGIFGGVVVHDPVIRHSNNKTEMFPNGTPCLSFVLCVGRNEDGTMKHRHMSVFGHLAEVSKTHVYKGQRLLTEFNQVAINTVMPLMEGAAERKTTFYRVSNLRWLTMKRVDTRVAM